MADMKKRYGKKKGESVFYATAESHDQKPGMSKSMKDDEEE